jgi:hypothetical protein
MPLKKTQKGAVALEFALTIPLVVTMVLILADIVIKEAMYSKITVIAQEKLDHIASPFSNNGCGAGSTTPHKVSIQKDLTELFGKDIHITRLDFYDDNIVRGYLMDVTYTHSIVLETKLNMNFLSALDPDCLP